MIKKALLAPLIAAVFSGACGTAKKLEVSKGQVQQLTEQNRQLKTQVSTLQNDVTNCTTGFKTAQDELAQYKLENRQLQEKLGAAQAVLKEQYAIMQQIEEKIDAALTDFKEKGVEVYFKK